MRFSDQSRRIGKGSCTRPRIYAATRGADVCITEQHGHADFTAGGEEVKQGPSNLLPRPRNVATPLRAIGQLYPTYLEPTEDARGHASSFLSSKPPAHNCCFFFSHFLQSHQTGFGTSIALLHPLRSTIKPVETAPSYPTSTTLHLNKPQHGQGGRSWCCRWHWTGAPL